MVTNETKTCWRCVNRAYFTVRPCGVHSTWEDSCGQHLAEVITHMDDLNRLCGDFGGAIVTRIEG